jgi:2-haloacid dehalogenase
MSTVVLDLGGVVVDWDPVPAVAAVVGQDRAERFVRGHEFDFASWNEAQDAGRPWDEAEAEALATHPHLAEEITAYRPHFALSLRGLVPGMREVLDDLRDRGVRLLALTNWSAETIHHLPEMFPEIFAVFDSIVVSGEERVAKPDPRIFEVLERRLGHPLTGVVYADDNPVNAEAARTAGMDALVFTGADALRAELRARALLD